MKKILIAEDDVTLRQSLRTVLESINYLVFEAGNGEEAITLFKNESPDIVLIDIIMPIKEGIETIIEMRKLDPRTRIIAMSGGGRLDAQDHLDMVSINLVEAKIFKPFKLQMLLDTINSLLGNDILNSCQTTTVTIPSNQLL